MYEQVRERRLGVRGGDPNISKTLEKFGPSPAPLPSPFLNMFFSFFLKILFVVVDKNISIYSHNYIIHFNDKSGEKLFTLNS